MEDSPPLAHSASELDSCLIDLADRVAEGRDLGSGDRGVGLGVDAGGMIPGSPV